MMKFKIIFSLILWIMMTTVTASYADEEPRIWIKNKTSFVFKSDVDAQKASIIEAKTKISLGHTWHIREDLPLQLSYYGDHIFFSDEDPLDFPHTIKSRGMKIETEISAPLIDDERFLFGVDVLPQFNTADGVGLAASAFRYPFNTYFEFKENEHFSIIAGVTIRPLFEHDVLPYAGVIYSPNDRLTFNLLSDETEHSSITYRFNDETTVALEFDYDFYEYVVTKGNHDGRKIQNQNFSTGISLEHKINKTFAVSIDGGRVFNRTIKFRSHPVKISPDDNYYAGFGVKASF